MNLNSIAPFVLLAPLALGGCGALGSLEYAITGETTYTDMGPAAAAKGVDKECQLSLPAIRKPFVDALNKALAERQSPARVYGFDCDGDGLPDIVPE